MFASVQILPGLAAFKQTLCPFMLKVKSLMSCTEGDLQLRRASAPLGSSQVPSGSGALSRQNWDAAPLQRHAHTSTYGQELSSLHMDLAVPADSWEGG